MYPFRVMQVNSAQLTLVTFLLFGKASVTQVGLLSTRLLDVTHEKTSGLRSKLWRNSLSLPAAQNLGNLVEMEIMVLLFLRDNMALGQVIVRIYRVIRNNCRGFNNLS
jgi:hypothetical protein